MDWFEQMAITTVLGILHQVIKNPGKMAAMKNLLLELADGIYESYAIVPPAHS